MRGAQSLYKLRVPAIPTKAAAGQPSRIESPTLVQMHDTDKWFRALRIASTLLFNSASAAQFSTHPLGCLSHVQAQGIQFGAAQKSTVRSLSLQHFIAAKKGVARVACCML